MTIQHIANPKEDLFMDNDFMSVKESIKKDVENRIQPLPVSPEYLDVKISVETELYVSYIDSFFDVIASTVPRDLPMTKEDFTNYVTTIVYSRVCWVNRKVGQYVVHPSVKLAVPSFISVVLANVGLASDMKLGVSLTPIMDKPKTLLSEAQLVGISNILLSLTNSGFVFGTGYARDKYGSWDFMAMQIVIEKTQGDDESVKGRSQVLRHDSESHPVYAVMASVLIVSNLATVLSPRVRYGFVDGMKAEILGLVRH